MLREIDHFLDVGGMREAVRPFYSHMGRPSIDPELIIRMLVIGYVMGIRSERRLCDEVHLNLAYRWFCRLGLEGKVLATISMSIGSVRSSSSSSCHAPAENRNLWSASDLDRIGCDMVESEQDWELLFSFSQIVPAKQAPWRCEDGCATTAREFWAPDRKS